MCKGAAASFRRDHEGTRPIALAGELEAVQHPNALMRRGPSVVTARAYALVAEAITGHIDAIARDIVPRQLLSFDHWQVRPIGRCSSSARPLVASVLRSADRHRGR